MKSLFLLYLILLTSAASAQGLSSNINKAEKMAIAMTTVDFAHLKDRLRMKVVTISEKENLVKVEMSVGTTERPNRIYNCMTFTFSQNADGFVEKVENEIDSGSCTF